MSLSFVSLFKVGSFVYPYIREMFRDIGKSKSRKKVTKPENHRLRTALVVAGIVSVLSCIYLAERLLTVSEHELEMEKKITELAEAASAAAAVPQVVPSEPVVTKKTEADPDSTVCSAPAPTISTPPKRRITPKMRKEQDNSEASRAQDLVEKLRSIE
jgi:hypothetical protein